MMKLLTGLIIILMVAFPLTAFGQAKVGTAGVQFLKVGVGARAVGMGEAFVAVADDASALYYNPGGLVQLSRPEATFGFIDYPAGLKFIHIGGILPTPQTSGVVGIQLTSLYSDDMVETTPARPYGTGRNFSASDLAMGLTYSQKLTEQFSVGITAKFLQERLADASATGWGADVGTFYATGWRDMNIGMIIQNFGPDMDFESSPFPLPIAFKFGASIVAYETSTYRWLLSSEFIHPNDNVEIYHFGTELRVINMVSLRMGKRVNGLIRDSWQAYQDDSQKNPFVEYPLFEEDEDGNLKPVLDGVSFGLGLHIPEAGIDVDYAWSGIGTLGGVHRFTLSYNLGNLLVF